MAIKVKVKKPVENTEKPCARCSENSEKTSKTYNDLIKELYKDVPVYTDYSGKIHVNKEYAKEFPELTTKLVEAEIEKNKNRTCISSTTTTPDIGDPFYIYYGDNTGNPNIQKTYYTSKNDENTTLGRLLKDILGPNVSFKYF